MVWQTVIARGDDWLISNPQVAEKQKKRMGSSGNYCILAESNGVLIRETTFTTTCYDQQFRKIIIIGRSIFFRGFQFILFPIECFNFAYFIVLKCSKGIGGIVLRKIIGIRRNLAFRKKFGEKRNVSVARNPRIGSSKSTYKKQTEQQHLF